MNTKNAFALFSAAAVSMAVFTGSASADVTASYSWDTPAAAVADGDGNFTRGNVGAYGSTTWQGKTALEMTEDPVSGTPQVYIGIFSNLNDGDVITTSALGWGSGSGGDFSKVRLWGFYVGEDGNYTNSGGGDRTTTSDYSSSDSEWTEINAEFTFDSSKGVGFMVEARIYSYSSTAQPTTWLTDLNASVNNDDAIITLPDTYVPAPGALALIGLGGLVARRRRS
tara:strand:- start:85 stop:759 length:675 start_codon:yes stop_codon:yes gene_type:complete